MISCIDVQRKFQNKEVLKGYREFLTLGSTKSPVELLKIAGVDLNDRNSFDYVFNEMYYFKYYSDENKFDLKQYIKRLLNAYNTCGGFSMNEHENNNKRAIKIILQEDFEAFKSEILLNFENN